MITALDTFRNKLASRPGGLVNPWRIQRVLPKTDPATKPERVASIATDIINQVELTLQNAPVWNIDGSIIVSGFSRKFAFLNGTYSYSQWKQNGAVITLNKVANVLITQQPLIKLRVRMKINSYEPITDLTPVRVGSRRTGRAFFVPAGRR